MRFLLGVILIFFSSCSFFQRKGSWGSKAIYPLHWNTIKHSFVKSASSPHFWGPLSVAGLVHVADWDQKISDWASSETPVYGSLENADKYSSTIDDVLKYEAFLSVLVPPSWEKDRKMKGYVINKSKGLVVVYISYSTAHSTTNNIRKFTYRERPNEEDFESFPSGHATSAAVGSTLSNRNIDNKPVHIFNTTLAAGPCGREWKASDTISQIL